MRTKSNSSEHLAKVISDNGLMRGKVPSPILRQIGARAGDYMIFPLTGAGKVEMRLSRLKKPAKGRAKNISKKRRPERKGRKESTQWAQRG